MEDQINQTSRWLEQTYQEFYHYISNVEIWMTVGKAVLKILLIIIAAHIVVKVITTGVSRIFIQQKKIQVNERRMETMKSLVSNIATYVVYFIAMMSVLSQLGFDLAPILASAGVVGLAVGFGAQNLVRDVITGFFIIFEDQFAVGDYVAIGNVVGTVQEIGLRITKIKSFTGEIHFIPNGSITQVTNYSIQNSVAILDLSVAYEEDIDRVIAVLEDVASTARNTIEELVAEPQVLGVQSFGSSEVVIRITAECKPMGHFSASRKLRALIKKEFDQKGIEIPYPRLVTIAKNQSEAI